MKLAQSDDINISKRSTRSITIIEDFKTKNEER